MAPRTEPPALTEREWQEIDRAADEAAWARLDAEMPDHCDRPSCPCWDVFEPPGGWYT
jgi:hypothetical protein